MPRYVAFLRAVNVGGRVVRMDALRRRLEDAGFGGVETFIASGNVVFDSRPTDAARLEARIEETLEAALGYRVTTFVRTIPELAGVATHEPFAGSPLAGTALYIAFLKAAPAPAARRALMGFASDVNDFRVRGREVYWLSRGAYGGIGMRGFNGALLEKTLGLAATLRNATTVRTLAAKCYDPRS
jgi:uncharacterized protein (DUF1697 family)